jgi:hypothetical protein
MSDFDTQIGVGIGPVVTAHAVYTLPDPASTSVLARACSHLNLIFQFAGAVGDVETLAAMEADPARRVAGRLAHDDSGSLELPVVRRVSMGSPLEIVTELPPGFMAIGGLTGLVYLAERLLCFHLEFRVRAEKLKAAANWDAHRSDSELQVLRNLEGAAQAQLAIDPLPTIELDLTE